MSTKFTYIYTLTDPRDGLIHYVGRTNSPVRRNYEHRSKLKTTYSQWHQELLAAGLKPVMTVVEEIAGTGAIAERMWIQKLREAGHPIVNSFRAHVGPIGTGRSFRGVQIKTAEEIRKEKAARIQAAWRRWWDSLSDEEKSRRQTAKVNEKSKQAGRDYWAGLTPEKKAQVLKERWERMSDDAKARVLRGKR